MNDRRQFLRFLKINSEHIYVLSVTIKIVRIFENNEKNNIKNILFNSGKLGKFVYTLQIQKYNIAYFIIKSNMI